MPCITGSLENLLCSYNISAACCNSIHAILEGSGFGAVHSNSKKNDGDSKKTGDGGYGLVMYQRTF